MSRLTDQKRALLQVKDGIVQAYQGGMSLRALAVAYNTSHASIRLLLKEEGVTMRPRGRQRKES